MTPKFSLRVLLAVIALIALLSGWYVDRRHLRQEYLDCIAARTAPHQYVITVKGTAGVRLSMTLFSKPANKEVKVITVPFTYGFTAVEAAAWFETLPGGQAGNDGDKYEISLEKDGTVLKVCEGRVDGNASATWVVGDF